MRLFGFNFGKSPDARIHVVEPKPGSDAFHSMTLDYYGFRRGMWVMRSGFERAGILVGMSPDGIARVMLVHEDGTNFIETSALSPSLRQAYLEEIPRARITLSDDEMVAMRYRKAPQ